MWSVKKKIAYMLYRIFAAWLPQSSRMRFARGMRKVFARGVLKSCGKKVNVERKAVFGPGVELGDFSGIGVKCELYGPIKIGKHVMMGPEVVIYTSGHEFSDTEKPMMEQGNSETKPVVIGDDVWIGRRVMIMPGVRIGDGCVIGAGAVVTKDIPAYSVAAGVPARVVKSRK